MDKYKKKIDNWAIVKLFNKYKIDLKFISVNIIIILIPY